MTDVLEHHIKQARMTPFSGALVVQEVMTMRAGDARRLLKDMVGDPIQAPDDHILARLAAANLVQREFNHRKASMMEGIEVEEGRPVDPKLFRGKEWTTRLPFSLEDYQEAMEYAQQNAEHYRHFTMDEEGNEVEDEPKKRGRKGKTFAKVKEYMLDHPETFDKQNRVDELAETIAGILDTSVNTTVQYIYKCRRLRKQGEI